MVEIEPIVLYLFVILTLLACCPPMICKMRQMFCSDNGKVYAEVRVYLVSISTLLRHISDTYARVGWY